MIVECSENKGNILEIELDGFDVTITISSREMSCDLVVTLPANKIESWALENIDDDLEAYSEEEAGGL